MRWHPLSLALLMLPAATLAAAIDKDWLDSQVTSAMQQADIDAAIVAVVHGDEHLVRAYGTEEDAVFRVGSVSKPVTASLMLSLAAEGVVELHEDLAGELSALPLHPALEQPLTLHHLLTHTAGFNERLFGQHTRRVDRFQTLDTYLHQHLPPRFAAPGNIIAYNDHHTALAGWLAEQRTGKTFAELARTRIFAPLGMTSSSFEQTNLPTHIAARLIRATNGKTPYPPDFIQLPPAAGMVTTAGDMAAYLAALLSGDLPGSDGQLTVQFRHHNKLPGRTYGFAEGRHGALTTFYKDGQASGFNARLLLIPEHRFGVFVAHNRNIFGPFGAVQEAGRFPRRVGQVLTEHLWPAGDAPTPPRPDSGHGADLSPYAGTYRTTVAARHTWERVASLFDEATITIDNDALRLGSRLYLPAQDYFVNAQPPWDAIAFRRHNEAVTHLLIGGGAYERVPAWTTQQALPWSLGLPLLLLAVSGVARVRRTPWSTVLGQGAVLGFFCGFAAVMWLVDVQQLFLGPPPILLLLLALPVIATAAFLWQLVDMARRPAWLDAIGIAAGTVLLVWLNYWNLLGWRLG